MANEASMPEEYDKYDEEWRVVMNTKGDYTLGKMQAKLLQEEISRGNRGIIMFNTFAISIPYIVEFYRVRRFMKGVKLLPARAKERPYKPISPEKWEMFKKEVYEKLGKFDMNVRSKGEYYKEEWPSSPWRIDEKEKKNEKNY